MSEQIDLLNELHLMQNQMNTMFKLFAPKKLNKDQKDLYDAHNEAVKSRKKTPDQPESTFGTKYLASQEKTNDYLARLIKTTDAVRSRDRNSSSTSINPLNIASNLGNFLEKDGNSKGITSALLKLPAGLLNFGKDISKKRELKKLDNTRQDFNNNKQLFEARTQELADMKKKHREENLSGVENPDHVLQQQALEAKIANQKELVKTKAKKFSAETEALQYKTDLKLDPKKYKGINATDVKSLRRNQERKMEDSLLSDIDQKPKNKNKKEKKILDQFNNPITTENKKSKTGLFDNFSKPLSGNITGQSSILNTKITISPASPSTFGETIGGIYYRLGTLIDENKKPDKKENESGGWLSSILGMLGGWLLSKIKLSNIFKIFDGLKSIGKFFMKGIKALLHPIELLKSVGGIIMKGIKAVMHPVETFGKLIEGISGPISKVAKFFGVKIGAEATKSAVSTGIKVAGEEGLSTAAKVGGGAAVKIGGKIAAKEAGKEALKIGGKGVGKSLAKKIPGLGLLFGLGFGVQKAMAGDLVGAGLEVASGATSLLSLTGIGAGPALAAGLALDAFSAKRDFSKAMNGTGTGTEVSSQGVSPTLQTGSEVDRTRLMSDQTKMMEEAMVRANRRSSKEDLETNEQTRARINANATLNMGSL